MGNAFLIQDGGRDFPAAKERRLLRQQSAGHASVDEGPDSEWAGRDENAGMRLKPDRSAEKNKFIGGFAEMKIDWLKLKIDWKLIWYPIFKSKYTMRFVSIGCWLNFVEIVVKNL